MEDREQEVKNVKIPEYNEGMYEKREKELYESQGKYGVMYSEDYEWSNAECTARAYGTNGHEGRSLAFHTPLLDKKEALDCIENIPKYNAFDPEKVAIQLEKMPEDTKMSVGREGSPVLYVWTDELEMLTSLFNELRDMKENDDDWTSGPDEYDTVSRENREYSTFHYPEDTDSNKVLIRAWWD